MAKHLGVDEFLNSGGDRSRGGSYLSGWKKDVERGGKIEVYLHRRIWCAKIWNHPIPNVQEWKKDGEKELVIRTERWNCHEAEALLMKRYDRTHDKRDMPPVLCPSCIFPEVLRELVAQGALSWTDPVFEWETDKANETHEILAGGVYNAFNSKEVDRNRDLVKELRKAGVNRKESWNQSLQVRLQWLFCVCDADKPEAGIMKTFESKGLGDKMKIAIKDEMRRAKTQDLGNPLVTPFPFEWSYDESKLYDDKYGVLALTSKEPSKAVLAVIDGPDPKIDEDLEPGNCWWLRNELTSHYVGKIDFPWDRVFGPAEKAGLMKPPEDSKADAAGDDRGPPDVGRGESGDEAPVLDVGPDHDVWFADAKPDPQVKGCFVRLQAPEADEENEAPTPEEIAQVHEILLSWGAAEVADVVECDHCLEQMTTSDVDCPHCASAYDEAGLIVGRPCLANKAHSVDLEGSGPNYICGTCGTIHALAVETADCLGLARWTRVEPPKAAGPVDSNPTGRRRRGAPEPAKEPEPPPPPAGRVRRGGVPFDSKGASK